MKKHPNSIIFIEPPGNIQKELHELRFACAKLTRNISILAFPELIPLKILEHDEIAGLATIETLCRGKIHISLQAYRLHDWLFLPTTFVHNQLLLHTPSTVPSWQAGYISFGTCNAYDEITRILAQKPPLSFSAGRILLADVTFYTDDGTSYTLHIKEKIYRKKK